MPPAPLVSRSALRPLVLHACTLAGLVMGMTAMGQLIGNQPAPWLAASIATAVMVRAAVSLATRRTREPDTSSAPIMTWCLVMGALNVPVAFLAAIMVTTPSTAAPLVAMVATIVGAPLGLLLGLLFGAVLSTPATRLAHAVLYPSDDGSDALLVRVGLWLMAVALLSLVVFQPTNEPFYPLWLSESRPQPMLFYVLCWGQVGLGAVMAGLATLQRRNRRQWIEAVARGESTRWCLGELTNEPGLGSLPMLGGTASECGHVLLRREDLGPHGYRHAQTQRPVARVPSAWSAAGLTPPRG